MSTEALVVLFSRRDHERVRGIDFPSSGCTRVALEELPRRVAPTPTLVVSGHSRPPTYLHRKPGELAAAISRFWPELLILDSCYGFSLPLLEALVQVGLRCRVLGASFKLPPRGLMYSPDLMTAGLSPSERVDRVGTRSGRPLESMTLDPDRLAGIRTRVDAWSRNRLRANLQRVHPNLVRVPVSGGKSSVLVPVAPSRFRRRSAAAA